MRQIGDKGPWFQTLVNNLLTASSPKAYDAAKSSLEQFIEKEDVPIIADWLTWWNDQKNYIFRAFKGYENPRSNLAEVIHAGKWLFHEIYNKHVLFGIN